MTEVLTPRFDDFIVLNSGEKIYPQELEDFYTKAAPVKEMCVFIVSGMHGVRKSKVLWAIIQPNLDNFREFGEVRSEERRVGKECASMCRSRWSPYH